MRIVKRHGKRVKMQNRRPLIGITPAYNYDNNETSSPKGYCEAINSSGGAAMLLSASQDNEVLMEMFQKCDGFLLTGGPDVDPRAYGEQIQNYCGSISPVRDYLEEFIIKKAIEYNKPMLGICRGMQSLNAFLGGTLYQDIHAQITDRKVQKHSQNAPSWYPAHDIAIEKDTFIQITLGKERIGVNSFHHQAVKELAPGFMATSRSDDGIIESIEYSGSPFVVGVQWHPEKMLENNRIFQEIFTGFIRRC